MPTSRHPTLSRDLGTSQAAVEVAAGDVILEQMDACCWALEVEHHALVRVVLAVENLSDDQRLKRRAFEHQRLYLLVPAEVHFCLK